MSYKERNFNVFIIQDKTRERERERYAMKELSILLFRKICFVPFEMIWRTYFNVVDIYCPISITDVITSIIYTQFLYILCF